MPAELTAEDVGQAAEQYEEILSSPGVRLRDAHGHEIAIPASVATFFRVSLNAACTGRAMLFSQDETMSPAEAAEVLGVSRPMIYRYIEDGLLEDRPVNTYHRIPAWSVQQLAAERRGAADHAARLLRDDPEHPRVVAARERIRARRAARQS